MDFAAGISEYVERRNKETPPDQHLLPVAEQRRLYHEMAAGFPAAARPDTVVTDEVVTDPDGRSQRVRMYRPARILGRGALLYIRGGGFVLGSLATHDTLVSELASNTGIVTFALDFRLAPEHPFPDPLEDCYSGLRGVVAAAARFGIEPAQVVLAGESSGANMAVVLAMMARDRGGPALRGQALISPVLDFTRWRQGGPDSPLLSGDEMAYFTACYCPDPQQAAHPYVSPLVSGAFHHLPPAYVRGSELDSLLVDSQQYVDRLRECGVPAELVVEPGLPHAAVRARGVSPAAADAWARYCAKAAALTNPVGAGR
jgi:acetyl esterase